MSLATGYPSVRYDGNCPIPHGCHVQPRMCDVGHRQQLPFSSLFMSSPPLIVATATAATISTGTPCALALNSTGTAMNYSGNATVTAPTCILYSDSAAANSASAGAARYCHGEIDCRRGGHRAVEQLARACYIPYSPSIPEALLEHHAGYDRHEVRRPLRHRQEGRSDLACMMRWTRPPTWRPPRIGIRPETCRQAANCWTSLSTSASNKTGMTVPSTYSGPIYIDANSAHGGAGSVDMQGKFSCSSCAIVMTNSDSTLKHRRDLVGKRAVGNQHNIADDGHLCGHCDFPGSSRHRREYRQDQRRLEQRDLRRRLFPEGHTPDQRYGYGDFSVRDVGSQEHHVPRE